MTDKGAMWEALLDAGVSEQTLQIVTDINGYTAQALTDVLYAHTGYESFENYGLDSDDDV